jgi:uncharacterized damage-inducible protein DinB
MITCEYCQLMARYNRWMNERLYALVSEFPAGERERDRGAFFGSMHGTHHRGQLTTLIRQAGRDPGQTDIPWLPGVVRFIDAPPER